MTDAIAPSQFFHGLSSGVHLLAIQSPVSTLILLFSLSSSLDPSHTLAL